MPTPIVLPKVAVLGISAVMKIYPTEPVVMACVVKVGNVLLPATPGDVSVLKVRSAASNMLSVEYRTFKLVTSAAK